MTEQNTQSNKKSPLISFLLVVMAIVIALSVAYVLMVKTNAEILPDASVNDINGSWTEELTSKTFSFVPKTNIRNFKIRFIFLDNHDKMVGITQKDFEIVKKGNQYTIKITMDEYIGSTKVEIVVFGKKTLF